MLTSSTSSTCSSSIATELVTSALAFVLNDHGFSLHSAMKAQELTVEQWRNEDDNIAAWNNFTGDLVTLLRTCFPKLFLPRISASQPGKECGSNIIN